MTTERFVIGSNKNIKLGKSNLLKLLKRDWQLLAMIFLPLLYLVIYQYIPMAGLVFAFKEFSFGKGIFEGEWAGLTYFYEFFNSVYFWRVIKNTFLIGIYSLVWGFPVPIIFALCLNELKNELFKKAAQTISYIPYFISLVVVVGMMYNFLSINGGIVNIILNKLGYDSINFLSSSEWFRILYVSSGIWQNFGFSSIIYLAAILGIDPQLYEAAYVDGVGRIQRIWYIILPGIKSTIIILLILSLGSIFTVGFEKIILMYSPGIYDVSDVVQTYVYRKGLIESNYSYATAVGFFNSVISFILLVISNYISRKMSETSLW